MVTIGSGDRAKLLVIPPLFAEHNLMRRQLVLIMRALNDVGFTSFLPDLLGWNESLHSLRDQSLDTWQEMIVEAIRQTGASHVLAVRSGAMLVPDDCKGWVYAPQSGSHLIRGMTRAQTLSNREAGIEMTTEQILESGREVGVALAGWDIGPELLSALEKAEWVPSELLSEISHEQVGSAGLWLRAEPDENAEQAERIAEVIAASMEQDGAEEA